MSIPARANKAEPTRKRSEATIVTRTTPVKDGALGTRASERAQARGRARGAMPAQVARPAKPRALPAPTGSADE